MSGSPLKAESTIRAGRKVARKPGNHSVGDVLEQGLSVRWEGFSAQLAVAQHRPTAKAIHDLRVATRRLIVFLDILQEMLPETEVPRLRKKVKRLFDALSLLRDVQVQITEVRDLIRRFPPLGRYLTILLLRERQLLKCARAHLENVREESLRRAMAEAGERLSNFVDDPRMRGAVAPMVLGMLARTYARAASMRPAADSGSPANVHRLRVAFKKFRYTVEVLEPVLSAVDSELLNLMNAYQTRMGEIQDLNVLTAGIRSHLAGLRPTDPARYLGIREHLLRRREELVGEFSSRAAELEGFWRALGGHAQ